MLYIAPRTYFGGLEYLPPQGPRTQVTAAYGVYGSLHLPLKPVLPRVFLFGDVDFLAGPEHDEFDWIATQYQYGVGWRFLPDWSIKFTSSAHALDTPLKTKELGGPDYVVWNAPSLQFSPAIPCPWSNVRADLEFYVFPPHNEYDPNPATAWPDRVTALRRRRLNPARRDRSLEVLRRRPGLPPPRRQPPQSPQLASRPHRPLLASPPGLPSHRFPLDLS
jgi:hypothetical protein